MKVLASSVIRLATKGDQHGGLYLVDFKKESCEEILNYNDKSIDWGGRGGERGLRGISVYEEKIYVATHNSILVYSNNFDLENVISSNSLKNIHEISIYEGTLYVSSTDKNAIVVYDLRSKKFIIAYIYKKYLSKKVLKSRKTRIKTDSSNHLNNVYAADSGLYFSGTKMNKLYKIFKKGKFHAKSFSSVPSGTHNVMVLNNNSIIYNDTNNNRICHRKGKKLRIFSLPNFANIKAISKFAKPGFARGLCLSGKYLVGGSSPATISLYDFKEDKEKNSPLSIVNITENVENAIHGLEIYPF